MHRCRDQKYTGRSGFAVGIRRRDPPGIRPLGTIDPSNCPLIAITKDLTGGQAIDCAIRSVRNDDARVA